MKSFYLVFSLWFTLSAGLQPLLAQEKALTSFAESSSFGPEEKLFPPLQATDPDPVFEFSLKKDLPIMAGSGILAASGLWLISETDPLNEAQVAALNPADINAFDRGATRQYRSGDATLSDYLLTVSALTPFSVLASRSVRREFLPVLVMYIETAALNGGLTSIAKGVFKRKRPYSYNSDVPMAERLAVDARHSFFSGHVSTSASFCFLTAYMVNRYAEKPGWKWAAWSGAVVIPGTIGYWRYTAGRHFPTDILTGYLIGAGTGILIPVLHKAQLPEDVSLNLQPLPYGMRMTLTF